VAPHRERDEAHAGAASKLTPPITFASVIPAAGPVVRRRPWCQPAVGPVRVQVLALPPPGRIGSRGRSPAARVERRQSLRGPHSLAGALAAVLLHAAGHERLMGRPCSPRQHLQRHLSARTPEHRRLHQAPRRLAARQRSQSRASMQGKAPQSPATFSSGFSPFRMQGRRRNAAARVQKDGRARALQR